MSSVERWDKKGKLSLFENTWQVKGIKRLDDYLDNKDCSICDEYDINAHFEHPAIQQN